VAKATILEGWLQGPEQAAGKGEVRGEIDEEHAAGAEARVDLIAVTARLKSCPVTRKCPAGQQDISLSVESGVFPQPVKAALSMRILAAPFDRLRAGFEAVPFQNISTCRS
jgi:hypothetical protein